MPRATPWTTAGPTSIDVAGQQLSCTWIGPPPADAPTLVVLHEGLGCAEQWRDVPAALAARTGCGALVYSRQGYGRSSPVKGPRPVRFMHDEALVVLPALLAACGIDRPVFVGHSDGASIAIIYAGAHAAPTPPGPAGPLVLLAPHVFVEDCTVASIARVRQAFETTDLRDRLSRYHGANTEAMARGWTDAWLSPEFRGWNIEGSLPGITTPVLLIQGRDDEYGTLRQVEAIASQVAVPCDTLILARCGHSPHRDRRAAVESAVATWIGDQRASV